MSFSYLLIDNGRYVLSVHPPYGSTVYSSKIIDRESAKNEITESEMESVIASAIWRMFDEERMFFSKRLDVSEIDVVMAGVRVLSVKLDGSVVMNPIGFTAKKIEVGLSETLVTRDLSEKIKEAVPKSASVLMAIEPAASCAWLIQKDSKHKDFMLASVSGDRTFLYAAENGEKISYVSDFAWGSDEVVSEISSALGVDGASAREIVRRYARSDMSSDLMKNLRDTVSVPFSGFIKGVTAAAHNAKMKHPVIYALCDDLAELDPKNVSLTKLVPKINFLPAISHSEIAFHELDHADMDSAFNKIARRRMKWLMCNK